MEFFKAYKAKVEGTPTYFIESTAPNNVDDDTPPPDLPEEYKPYLSTLHSNKAIEEIAEVLAGAAQPNLVVMVHGFNNPEPAVLRMYKSAVLAIGRDPKINSRKGLVCVGYRWPSENMGAPKRGARDALPTLASRVLRLGIAIVVLSLLLYLFPTTRYCILNWLGRIGEHAVSLLGWTLAGLMSMAVLLRIIVYFRDNYRASNYGIPDLIQIIRAIDSKVKELRDRHGGHHPRPVELSFIGHSMGGFVVTNTIRTLSDVFSTPVKLNEFGAAGPKPDSGGQQIGHVFELKRFVLASPDIPAEALLSSRGNFLASALSRFEEAYLFSNEGDEVLRQISTLANYFVFPAKSSNHGFRLGNAEILSRGFGVINPDDGGGFLQTLRVGNLTLKELYDTLDAAEAQRHRNDEERIKAEARLPEVFTYFDCTDYVDVDNEGVQRPLLTFAKRFKRHDGAAKMSFRSHMRLLFDYVFFDQKPNVHGGYFEGLLSQLLIYRLACLGFGETVTAFCGEDVFASECEKKQIRVLLSPFLRERHSGPAAALVRKKEP